MRPSKYFSVLTVLDAFENKDNQTTKQTNERKTNTIKDKQTHTEIEEEKEIRWEVFHIK